MLKLLFLLTTTREERLKFIKQLVISFPFNLGISTLKKGLLWPNSDAYFCPCLPQGIHSCSTSLDIYRTMVIFIDPHLN